jgi:hypothetical protein
MNDLLHVLTLAGNWLRDPCGFGFADQVCGDWTMTNHGKT